MSEQTNLPSNDGAGLTRREMNARLIAAAAGGVVASGAWILSATPALAQPRVIPKKKDKSQPTTQPTNQPGQSTTGPGGKSILDDVIKKGRVHDWNLRVSLHLDSYQDTPIRIAPGTKTPQPTQQPGLGTPGSSPTIIPFKFTTAAVVFPSIQSTATSQAQDTTAKILFDQRDATSAPTYIENLPEGARYGRWDMKDKEGRAIDADFEIPASCWETIIDEARAAKAIWPASGKWSKVGSTCLGQTTVGQLPVIDPNLPKVHEVLTAWCSGKPPQSIPPYQLAKYLASKAVEAWQPSGDGLVSATTGLLEGFDLRSPEGVLNDGRGNEHELPCALCSIYRAAGLPSRVVIGVDLTESRKGQDIGLKRRKGEQLRTWVEFLLYDETAKGPSGEGKELWVPVDIVRQRKFSSRAPSIDRIWKYFGNNDDTDDIIPVSFHYHPPLAGVVAHGAPCFWGWMTTPEIQQATQSVRFTTTSAVRRPEPSGGGSR